MTANTFPWRLVTFRRGNNGIPTTGVLLDGKVVDFTDAFLSWNKPNPTGMRDILRWHASENLADFFKSVVKESTTTYPVGDVQLLSPITDPRMVYDFLGFEEHVRQIRSRRGAEFPQPWYKRPGYYVGSASEDKIFGEGEVVIPRFVEKPDYETEFAMVVGKEGKITSIEDAADFIKNHCFFTIFNDWSARDYQKKDMELGLSVSHSKMIIGSSFGPTLVHGSEYDYNNEGTPSIGIKLTVNGEVRRESNYNTVYWSFAKILTFMGKENVTVYPGDIFGSGTIGSGCIAEFAPKVVDGKEVEAAKYPWLKDGDKVEIEADKIGTLKSTVKIV
jgi:2-keto-4-pentenoate hydratase/2-oxohepta-3-ene-1,7-dioic acid hydratase in catechol pathway